MTRARLSVAPMIDWTDSPCRQLHRAMSRRARLYTEMIAAPALVRGGALRLLEFDASEHPVALQIGGEDPEEVGAAARLGDQRGYDEINLNVGCPSDRVKSGCFGAVLMKDPVRIGEIVSAMHSAVSVPVTVKCRIGVDEQEPRDVLPAFIETVRAAGASEVIIHARKAWLQCLSPKENREIPPLDYPLVHEMAAAFPDLPIWINGGITSLDQANAHLDAGLAGVMIGRAAYQRPADILIPADAALHGVEGPVAMPEGAVRAVLPRVEDHLASGGKVNAWTRHMLGLFSGRPGAKEWRRTLSEGAHRKGAGVELIEAALAHVEPRAEAA